ncbi:hypothetical protein [Burkholderia territorii]|uniref:hypothetical protein n=1 Tax=Burkholderia territorii TaxID=1503055 RepID=UPI0018C8CE36|nr:hypothetical protein [Burkholderia territorii]
MAQPDKGHHARACGREKRGPVHDRGLLRGRPAQFPPGAALAASRPENVWTVWPNSFPRKLTWVKIETMSRGAAAPKMPHMTHLPPFPHSWHNRHADLSGARSRALQLHRIGIPVFPSSRAAWEHAGSHATSK